VTFSHRWTTVGEEGSTHRLNPHREEGRRSMHRPNPHGEEGKRGEEACTGHIHGDGLTGDREEQRAGIEEGRRSGSAMGELLEPP
jgi:hypothetical protein